MSTLTFQLTTSADAPFTSRLGIVSFRRSDGSSIPNILTPGFITTTSRGVVPHLSKDNLKLTTSVRWTQMPFESFLERNPPIPIRLHGLNPLHTFLGHSSGDQLISLCIRDPNDGRELPPNGNDFVSAYCVRGVRQVSPSSWRSYVLACKPDVVTALADIPLNSPPFSQKRMGKSLERSIAWLTELLRPVNARDGQGDAGLEPQPLNVLVSMVGGTDMRARRAFSDSLVEKLHGNEAEVIKPLSALDEGISGYVFELLPLRANVCVGTVDNSSSVVTETLTGLMKASLDVLPASKLRVVHSASSPHEILRLVRDIGVDLLDARWAQEAADIGIALDFRFPAPNKQRLGENNYCSPPKMQSSNKRDLGHNLFDTRYACDHSRLSFEFLDGISFQQLETHKQADMKHCPCGACSPMSPLTSIVHNPSDEPYLSIESPPSRMQRPFSRAYIHHLLHTHEMSSHTLLVMHNLAVLDAFFAGIRDVLTQENGLGFADEVEHFVSTYDEDMRVFKEARAMWARVERERGKGRLHREKNADSSE